MTKHTLQTELIFSDSSDDNVYVGFCSCDDWSTRSIFRWRVEDRWKTHLLLSNGNLQEKLYVLLDQQQVWTADLAGSYRAEGWNMAMDKIREILEEDSDERSEED